MQSPTEAAPSSLLKRFFRLIRSFHISVSWVVKFLPKGFKIRSNLLHGRSSSYLYLFPFDFPFNYIANYTAMPYREIQGKPGNANRDPAMRTGFPSKFFPVGIDLQGVPCKPYRVWVYSALQIYTVFNCVHFPL